MPNAFGVNDDRVSKVLEPIQISKGSVAQGLKMVEQAGKPMKRPTMGSGKSYGPALMRRLKPAQEARKNVAQSNFNGLPQRLKAARG